MTPEELRELAGLNTLSKVEADKKWADDQLKQNQPNDFATILNRDLAQQSTPLKKLEQKLNQSQTLELEDVAARLNTSMMTPATPKKVKVQPQVDEIDNVAARLNATLRTSSIKIERLS